MANEIKVIEYIIARKGYVKTQKVLGQQSINFDGNSYYLKTITVSDSYKSFEKGELNKLGLLWLYNLSSDNEIRISFDAGTTDNLVLKGNEYCVLRLTQDYQIANLKVHCSTGLNAELEYLVIEESDEEESSESSSSSSSSSDSFAIIDYLIAHYKLNDNAETFDVIDDSGNGLTGTSIAYTSEMTTTGKINAGFNMFEQHIGVTDNALMQFGTNPFTLSFWFKPVDNTPAWVVIKNSAFGFRWMSDTEVPQVYSDPGYITVSKDSWNLDQWYHIVLTRDSTSVYFYVDGVLDGTSNSIANFGNGYDFEIGYSASFNGCVDDVRLYSCGFTQDDVDSIYNGGVGTED